jgi:hypothetical protein
MKAQKTLGELAAIKTPAPAAPAPTPAAPFVPNTNPVVDAKIDAFIAANPKLHEYYKNLTPERLVRACMLFRADEAEREIRRQSRQLEECKKWVEQSPSLKSEIFAKIDTLAKDKRTGAFVNLVRRAQQNAGRFAAPVAPRDPTVSQGV